MNDLQELSTFSHEINNSLTLIYGQIQCIEKTYDTLTGNDHWNRMKDDFSSLFDFIHQFLAPAEESSAAMEPLDLISVISEIRSSWSYYLHKEQIRFFIQADPGTAFYVYGARSKLFQLFHNLISNAVKAIQQKKGDLPISSYYTYYSPLKQRTGTYCIKFIRYWNRNDHRTAIESFLPWCILPSRRKRNWIIRCTKYCSRSSY